jgi:hypothetical protein
MKTQNIRYFLTGVLMLLSVASTAPSVGATVTEEQPNVHFVATLNNGPAMQAVKWSVYRINDDRSTLVESFQRHSASLALAPGRYRAEATLNSVNRSRVFDVGGSTSSNVVVAMD